MKNDQKRLLMIIVNVIFEWLLYLKVNLTLIYDLFSENHEKWQKA
jgi:hypothetical protein